MLDVLTAREMVLALGREALIANRQECTVIHKAVDSGGYIAVHVDGKNVTAHRYVYQQLVGDIADGLVVRHTCNNRHCTNPNHLTIGTQQDNCNDTVEPGILRKPRIHRSAAFKMEAVAYSNANSINATVVKFGVPRSCITSWRKLLVEGTALLEPHASKRLVR